MSDWPQSEDAQVDLRSIPCPSPGQVSRRLGQPKTGKASGARSLTPSGFPMHPPPAVGLRPSHIPIPARMTVPPSHLVEEPPGMVSKWTKTPKGGYRKRERDDRRRRC